MRKCSVPGLDRLASRAGARERLDPMKHGTSDSKLDPQGDDEIRRTSLHDAEGKVRDPSALDHPRPLQVDRAGP